MRKTKALLGIVLLVLPLALTGCGNEVKLARIGNVVVQLANGFEGEVNALEAAGLLKDPRKLAALKQKVSAAKISANALNTYLLGLKEVNQNDKAAITQKVAELTAIVTGVLINQDAFGLSENTGAVVVLRYATISLNQIALVIAALNPPPVAVSSAGVKTGIPVNKISVTFDEPPAEVKRHLTVK